MAEPQLSDFDFELPDQRIAQEPVSPRDAARLLVSRGAAISHHRVSDLDQLLQAGDLLVLNRTRVIPARLFATKNTGGQLEVLLIHPLDDDPQVWRCLVRGKVRIGSQIAIDGTSAEVVALGDDGHRDVRFPADCSVLALAERCGHVPLPPYIRRSDTEADRERYQTVFGDRPGSVAAPTASLHLTEELLARLEARGVQRAMVELAVGPGTFKPVQHERITEHPMHAEHCVCPPETVAAIEACRHRGGRVIAVGTTVVRTLETAAASGTLAPYEGWTRIFLHPPQSLSVVDGLLTNFHLPRSTLLMLVACLTGIEHLHTIYQAAIDGDYRFYSYGDASLILPG
ncbi:MAG: tRNA preQ1(34) S-adenosylmethionine ribosyltransferase-isomerase QueA [Planctomycetota bacterium]|jgi:S-adenosylmethionine:tRNA ribosyltransferase-isomerase|nr:tRNA preQ1(34) S-adenosylmethionine ribosyltransferase-isomerase QueA [Planctomycetota bacterium]